MFKAQRERWSEIKFVRCQALEPIHGAGIASPNLDATIQVGIGSAEEVSTINRSQQPWRLPQGIDLVFHVRVEIGLLFCLKSNDRLAQTQIHAEYVDIDLRSRGDNRETLLIPS